MDNFNENNQTFFRFEDLRVYHKALKYVDWVHLTVQLFPEHESQHLTTKFVNAAQAIALQIAEGSSRNKTQFVYYLKTAKSSIRECVVYTAIASGLKYISEEQFEDSRNHLMELTKMIGALIGSLQRSGNFDEE